MRSLPSARRTALTHLWDQNLREMGVFVPTPLDPETLDEIGVLAHQYIDGRRTRCCMTASTVVASWTATATSSPTTPTASTTARVSSTASSSTTACGGETCCTTSASSRWTSNASVAPTWLGCFSTRYREFSAESHPRHSRITTSPTALWCARRSPACGAAPEDQNEARAYLSQCLRHLQAGRVRLVVIGGLPGTGKSTLAMAVGECARLAGAPIRRAAQAARQDSRRPRRRPPPTRRGCTRLPTPKRRTRTCSARRHSCCARARAWSSTRSFAQSRWREASGRAVANQTSSDLVELRCVLRHDLVAGRLVERSGRGDASDADAASRQR